MTQHGTQFDFPQLHHLDPSILDYDLIGSVHFLRCTYTSGIPNQFFPKDADRTINLNVSFSLDSHGYKKQ